MKINLLKALSLFNVNYKTDPLRPLFASFITNFCTLSALYVIQPIRDEFATAAGLKVIK